MELDNKLNYHTIQTIILSILVIVIVGWVMKVAIDNFMGLNDPLHGVVDGEDTESSASLQGFLYLSAIPLLEDGNAFTNIFKLNLASGEVGTLSGDAVDPNIFAYSLTRSQNSLDNYVILPTDNEILNITQTAPYHLRYNDVTETYTTDIVDVEVGLFSHNLRVNSTNSVITFTTIMPDQFDVIRDSTEAWTVVIRSLNDEFETIYLTGATNPIWLSDTSIGYVRADGIYEYELTLGEERRLVAVGIHDTQSTNQDVFKTSSLNASDTLTVLHQDKVSYLLFTNNEVKQLFLTTLSNSDTVPLLDSLDFSTTASEFAVYPYSLTAISSSDLALVKRPYLNNFPAEISFLKVIDQKLIEISSLSLPEFVPNSVLIDFWQFN